MRCVVVCDPAQMGATARAVTAARTIPGLQALTLLAPDGLYSAASAPCDVLAAAAPCFATPEAASALVGAVCASATNTDRARVTHVLAPATLFGRAVLPRAAAAVCAPCVTDVVKFDGAQRLQRHTAAGRLLETISVTAPFALFPPHLSRPAHASSFARLRPAVFFLFLSLSLVFGSTVFAVVKAVHFALPGARAAGAAPPSVRRCAAAEAARVAKDAVDGLYGPPCTPCAPPKAAATGPQLAAARRVVAGGLGMQTKEGFAALYPLARTVGAAVAGSRAAVERGFCGETQQVGQTGQTVAPELYVAVGISGAVQHTAGMRESRTVVVVNTDESAPFFRECDYGLVAPAEKAVPELARLLGAATATKKS